MYTSYNLVPNPCWTRQWLRHNGFINTIWLKVIHIQPSVASSSGSTLTSKQPSNIEYIERDIGSIPNRDWSPFFYCMYLRSILYFIRYSDTSPSEQELGTREAVWWCLISSFKRITFVKNLRYIVNAFCVVIRPASTCIITTHQKANNFGINVITRGRKLYKIVLIIAVTSLDYTRQSDLYVSGIVPVVLNFGQERVRTQIRHSG